MDLQAYLISDDIIDHQHPSIVAQAAKLNATNEFDTIKQCFEFVRDDIRHSWDYRHQADACVVTLKASDVLAKNTGFCYAKCNLLVALLRANGIAAGLSYQRVEFSGGSFLHGLTAIWFNQAWYLTDPRGNKDGIDAQFNPPKVQLAYPDDFIFTEVFSSTCKEVVDALSAHSDVVELFPHLPSGYQCSSRKIDNLDSLPA